MREIVLDTETTGFDPKSGHRLVEIGCVELINQFPSGNVYHEYINPERDMPNAAFQVHGLSTEFLSDKPLFTELAEGFLNYIDGAKLIIHNAAFDIGFLNYELEILNLRQIGWDHVIDTLALSRTKFPGAQNSLDALCRRFGIDNSAREKHGALLDAELLAEVYIELSGGHQANLMFSDTNKAGSADNSNSNQIAAKQRPEALAKKLTEQEQEAHNIFIQDQVKNAMWERFQ